MSAELVDVIIGASVAVGRTTELATSGVIATDRVGGPRKRLLARIALLENVVAAARAVAAGERWMAQTEVIEAIDVDDLIEALAVLDSANPEPESEPPTEHPQP
jgi:hypothetical protein